jgi:hypothetical protein
MPRKTSPDLTIPWKIQLDAGVAGAVEHQLLDKVHGKPKYAARKQLIEQLLRGWLATGAGVPSVVVSKGLLDEVHDLIITYNLGSTDRGKSILEKLNA